MNLNSQMKAVIDQFIKFSPVPVETLSVNNARNAPTLNNAVAEMMAEHIGARMKTVAKPTPEPVGEIRHIVIPTCEGNLLARVFIPKGDGPFPVLVYFHGGGWVLANIDTYEPSCRALCNAVSCVVVSVAYRQAPENKYPAAVNDAYAATQWIMANAARVEGRPEQVAVGGESAGANLAAVACLKAKAEGGRMPVAQLLIYPVTDFRMNTSSYDENKNSIPLHSSMMPWFWNHYLAQARQGLEPYASPLLAEDLSGLAPALVITAEFDPLRDEGEAYGRRLAAANVSVRSFRAEGVSHEFFGLAGLVDEAKNALDEAAHGLTQLFEKGEFEDSFERLEKEEVMP